MEEKKSEGVESGCVSQAEGAKTDAPSLGPVTLGEKKRIIRKVSVLDPSRLSKLGLDKIIIQAVSKLKEPVNSPQAINGQPIANSSPKPSANTAKSSTIKKLQIVKHGGSKPCKNANPKIEVDSKGNDEQKEVATPKLTSAEIKLLLRKRVQARGAARQESAQTVKAVSGDSANNIKNNKVDCSVSDNKRPKIDTIHRRRKKSEQVQKEESVATDAFCGFTKEEISEGDDILKRLCDAIRKFESNNVKKIPSFVHLKTYLNKRKTGQAKDLLPRTRRDSEIQPKPENQAQTLPSPFEHTSFGNNSVVDTTGTVCAIPSIPVTLASVITVPPVLRSLEDFPPPNAENELIPESPVELHSVDSVPLTLKGLEDFPPPNAENELISANPVESNSVDSVSADLRSLEGVSSVNVDNSVIPENPVEPNSVDSELRSEEDHNIQIEETEDIDIIQVKTVEENPVRVPTEQSKQVLLPSLPIKESLLQPTNLDFGKVRNTAIDAGSTLTVGSQTDELILSESSQQTEDAEPKPILSDLSTPKSTNKGIIILDQQIFKSGTPLPASLLGPDFVIDGSFPGNSFKKEKSPPKPSVSKDRTILVKLLSEDTQSEEIKIEIVDPLLVERPEKTMDPIRNICKSYMRKMLKSTGIKQIKINPSQANAKSAVLSNSEADGIASHSGVVDETETNQMLVPKQEVKTAESENYTIIVDSNQYEEFINQTPDQGNENPPQIESNETVDHGNFSANDFQSNEPLDAVEYILNCTQNDMTNSMQFEGEEDFEDVNWDDDDIDESDDDNATPNTQVVNGVIGQEYNQQVLLPNSTNENLVYATDPNIVSMIEQAEITFAVDVKPSVETISFANVGDAQEAKNMLLQNSMVSPVPVPVIKTEKDLQSEPPISIQPTSLNQTPVVVDHSIGTDQVTGEEKNLNGPPKKRKRTILHYTNVVKAPVDEITERIKQRMIDKGRKLNDTKESAPLEENEKANKNDSVESTLSKTGENEQITEPESIPSLPTDSNKESKQVRPVPGRRSKVIPIMRGRPRALKSTASANTSETQTSTVPTSNNSQQKVEKIDLIPKNGSGSAGTDSITTEPADTISSTGTEKSCEEVAENIDDINQDAVLNTTTTESCIDTTGDNSSLNQLAQGQSEHQTVVNNEMHAEILEAPQIKVEKGSAVKFLMPVTSEVLQGDLVEVYTESETANETDAALNVNSETIPEIDNEGAVANELERKSSRVRKPKNNGDFVITDSKNTRKGTKKLSSTDEAAPINTTTGVRESDMHPGNSTDSIILKPLKSRRKNTIPEIDKLARKRQKLDAEQVVGEPNQTESVTTTDERVETSPQSTPPIRRVGRPPKIKRNINKDRGLQRGIEQYFSSTPTLKPTEDGEQYAEITTPETSQNLSQPLQNHRTPSKPTVKRRGRPPKNRPVESTSISVLDDSAASINSEQDDGRKKKTGANDYTIDPRIILAKSRNDLTCEISVEDEMFGAHKIKKEPQVDRRGMVQCGACKELMAEGRFVKHLPEHYGVGWREGLDPPINMSSYREVLNAMIQYMYRHKVTSFECKFCQGVKKSAAGFLAHLFTCLLSKEQLAKMMEPCKFCEKAFIPHALWTHLKICKENPDNRKELFGEEEEHFAAEPKRRSAIKATSSFKAMIDSGKLTVDDFVKPYQPLRAGGLIIRWKSELKKHGIAKCPEKTCSYESETLDELKGHFRNCEKLHRGGFSCVRCNFYSMNEADVRSHASLKHEKELKGEVTAEREKKAKGEENDFSASNCESDSEDESSESEVEKRPLGIPNITKVRDFLKTTKSIYDEIHADEALFPNLLPSEMAFSRRPFGHFLPIANSSIRYNFIFDKKIQINKSVGSSKLPEEWFELEQFETMMLKGETMTFIGGPITNCAWAPKPKQNMDKSIEYLAVSFKRSYTAHTKLLKPVEEDALILIYKIETALNDKSGEIKTELQYGVQCIGPINHFVFLPSGGYVPELNRLGLLAVSSAKSDIHIYSLPLEAIDTDCDNTVNKKSCNILDLKPSLILRVDLSKNLKEDESCVTQCTRLVWSEVKNHNIIVGGYANGFVGLWDIREEDNLTKFCNDGVQCFVPISFFNTIGHAVTGLAMHYMSGDPRWLVVTNRIRDYRIYDLEDMSNPIQVVQDGFQKSTLSSAVWPIYTENPVMSLDDDYIEDATYVFTRSLHNVTFRTKHEMHSSSGYTSLEFSPYYNAFIGGCENGDIIIQRYKSISTENIWNNAYPRKFIFFSDIIRLDGKAIPSTNPKKLKGPLDQETIKCLDSFDDKCKDEYGLMFGGPMACARQNKSEAQAAERSPPFALRPLTRVSCLALCPNAANACIVAVGYYNGLIRLKYLNFNGYC